MAQGHCQTQPVLTDSPIATFFVEEIVQLSETLTNYIRACFAGIWIESHEHDDAITDIAAMCERENWSLATWDLDAGLNVPGSAASEEAASSDPIAALRSINGLASEDGAALLVLKNFHRLLGSPEIVQAVARQISLGKQNRTFLIVLAPVVQIPIELEKLFVVVSHDLPDRDQLERIARDIATESGELPEDQELNRVLDSASGLTRYEAEGAFSLSLVQHGRVAPEVIWNLKSQTLRKSGLLGLHRGEERFDQLGGLDSLKAFCRRALARSNKDSKHRPRGVLLLSPPGCGKSQFAKSLGNETGRPTLTLDIGSLMGSLVGQSEHNIRRALQIADAMAPAILFCDEIEKGLAGAGSSGQTDSGVTARVFGNLLTWLNDHTSDVFVVATCNDISRLPPEFARAERFDGVFFVDLPSREQRDAIWQIFIREFELDTDQERPDDELWTGAEIRACCRLSALLDVPLVQAAANIVPVASTSAESVDALRSWASGRCLSADRPGIFTSRAAARRRRRRAVQGNPLNN